MSEPRAEPQPMTCARCARCARDADDRATWATIEDESVCPGCLTLMESEAHRSADS